MSSNFKPAPITGKGKTQVNREVAELAKALTELIRAAVDIRSTQDLHTGALTYHLAAPDKDAEDGYKEITITIDADFPLPTDEQIDAALRRVS